VTERYESDVLRRRLERERLARREAESIAERVTAELYAATTQLRVANEAIREFAAVASHDIRNPLTFILGSSQLLLDNFDAISEEQRRHLLETIISRGRMLERLVDDLLTVSKLDAGAIEAHTENIRIGLELDRVMANLGDDAAVVTVRGSDDLEVNADPDHVERILTNYITNAIKYGAPPIDVRLAPSDDGFVEIRVIDRGAGVPPEFAPHLFAKFARAGNTSAQGTGLGLSIVRGLAVANGGDAWYEPNLPNGSCFAVKLPAGS
jgi:signal transduction histidine kinase